MSSFWNAPRRCASTVFSVTNSCCAIPRLVRPLAASSATRRSLGVSASRPLRAIRRGRAPAASSSSCARVISGAAPERVARSSPRASGSRAAER